jgi:hypothetical protein
MKSLLLLLPVLIIFFCITHESVADEKLTRQQAVSILVKEIIDNSPNRKKIMAYGPQEPLSKGDVVEPAFLPKDTDHKLKQIIENATWFFWIDDNASNDLFAHPTRFVFIDATNSQPTIDNGILTYTSEWWPKINGIDHYKSSDDREKSDDIVYGAKPSLWKLIFD